jgi:DNA-binding response OmpR family regulator
MKILIVDGDDTLLSILAGELEARGFEVVPMHLGDGDCRSAKRKARLNSFFPIIASSPAQRSRMGRNC